MKWGESHKANFTRQGTEGMLRRIMHEDALNILLARTKEWPLFPPEERGLFHTLASLIISQRIPFSRSQAMRARIYKATGASSLDVLKTVSKEEAWALGVKGPKWTRIEALREAFKDGDPPLNEIRKIPGVGPWTEGSTRIMFGDYSLGFVHGDKAVQAEAGRILGRFVCEKELKAIVGRGEIEAMGRLFSRLWYRTGPGKDKK